MSGAKIIAVVDGILSIISKLGLLDRASADDNKIRDQVIESVHTITNGLRECIAHLNEGLRNSNLADKHEQIRNMMERLVAVRNELQSGHVVLAEAYAEGGDSRDHAHLTMLELGTLVKGIKSINF